MKKIFSVLALLILALPSAFASTLTLFQEDFETGFDGWTTVGSSNDVGTDDSILFRRLSCPGDFSTCGGDNKNDYFWAEDDAGIKKQIEAKECDADAEVTFWTRTALASSGDESTLSYSLSGDGSHEGWDRLVEHNTGTWTQYTESIPGSAGNSFYFALWLNNGENDFGKFDDVQVTCEVREPQNEVPEFGVVAAGAALAGAGAYIARKRKN